MQWVLRSTNDGAEARVSVLILHSMLQVLAPDQIACNKWVSVFRHTWGLNVYEFGVEQTVCLLRRISSRCHRYHIHWWYAVLDVHDLTLHFGQLFSVPCKGFMVKKDWYHHTHSPSHLIDASRVISANRKFMPSQTRQSLVITWQRFVSKCANACGRSN